MSYTPTVVTAAPTQASHLTKLDYALAWADRGFPVFPLQENGKEPLGGSSGHLRATVDAAEIRTLWTDPLSGMSLEYNIGCGAPPGYLFLDLDEKDGRNGKAKYEALGGTVDGLVVRTPSGGFHVYLKTERDTANTAGKVAPGIDTRGQDGYLVAPGSTIDGVRYEVVQDDSPLAAPQFLMDRLPDPTERIQTVTTYAVEPDQPGNIERAVYWAKVAPSAVSGTWHTEGFKRGCEMARIGLSAEKAVEVLREHWIPRGSGFKSDDQFVRDVLGGYHAAVHDGEHGQESVDAAEASFIGIAVEPPPPDTERESALFTPGKLRLLTVADCANSTPRQYVVKGLLSAGDVGIVMGAPGAGKSVFAPHVAWGGAWRQCVRAPY
ncbi:MAG: bifunctional DNA primase/polymerase [Rhodospirillales bacterium]